jgi:hypothetical protein
LLLLAPEVTAGLSADAEVRLFKENTEEAYVKSGDLGDEEAVSRPLGLKAETFKAESWVNFDWQKMSLKAAGKWDALKADEDDFSWVKVDAVWKDFFGFEIAYTHERNNKERPMRLMVPCLISQMILQLPTSKKA